MPATVGMSFPIPLRHQTGHLKRPITAKDEESRKATSAPFQNRVKHAQDALQTISAHPPGSLPRLNAKSAYGLIF